ncbi:substrate binding domain-containing protein [Achromobacter dolens]|uniref:substrate binding domain-containing protein n=1 Tax=Achromobacter dolens TaxID=1287738 RepID=UPI0022B88701|nr:substrate binding domain-containing protein [Achromobacter dolens]MCZ8406661.1 substrate binding domain-containing protein [Achromobacter dolens]
MTPLPRMEVFAKVTSVGAFGRAAAALGIPLTPPPRQAASAGRDAGLLRVDLPDARTRQALAPLLAAFAARHPGLRFQLSVTPAASPAPDGADLTIRLEPPCDPSWLAHRLGALRARLYAAPEYLARRPAPERPADLAAHDCIGVHADDNGAPARWQLRRGQDRAVVMTRERYCVDDPEMARQLAARGAGIAPLREAAPGLVAVLPDWELEPVALYALTSAPRLPVRTRALIAHLTQALAD